MIENDAPIRVLMDALLVQGTVNVALDIHPSPRRSRARDEFGAAHGLVAYMYVMIM